MLAGIRPMSILTLDGVVQIEADNFMSSYFTAFVAIPILRLLTRDSISLSNNEKWPNGDPPVYP